jgi:hypothetical protein
MEFPTPSIDAPSPSQLLIRFSALTLPYEERFARCVPDPMLDVRRAR